MHEAMMVEPRRLARARLQQAQAQLDHATAERDRLQQATAPDHADTASRQGLLIASMALTQSNQEVRGLQQAVGDQQARLSASYSYGTSLAWPIYVPEKPSSPNRLLIWAGGLLLGVSLGVLAAIARNARRRVSGR
jgi:LPS O-antigen subunit length determinant protein (WzzB/FepE family)